MVTFIEVVPGDMDLTHIGKVIVYLSKLMEAQPNRTHVYGALTNLEYTTLYHCTGSKIRHSQPVKYEEGVAACLLTHLSCSFPSCLRIENPDPWLPLFFEESGLTHHCVMQAGVKWDGAPLHTHEFV